MALKRSKLSRHTPMPQATKPIQRRCQLKNGTKGLKPGRPHRIPRTPRAVVAKRSGGWCEPQIEDVCVGRATDFQHRIAQGAGGVHGEAVQRSDRPSNGLHCCRPCHDWIHAHPAESQEEGVGWSVRHGFDPAWVPVRRRGEVVYLGDGGEISPVGVVA